MTKIKFRKLIDLAIGTPEPGHVDFQALHYLLTCFADRLHILNDKVDYVKPAKKDADWSTLKVPCELFTSENRYLLAERLSGGADAPAAEPEPAAAAEPATEAPADVEAKPAEEKPAEAAASQAPEPQDAEVKAPEMEPRVEEPNFDDIEPSPQDGQLEASPQESMKPQPSGADLGMLPMDDLDVIPLRMKLGVSMMKDQLELAMQQVTIITDLLLDKKQDRKRFVGVLNHLQHKLRNLLNQNTYIESLYHADGYSISWHASDDIDECIGDLEEMKSVGSKRSKTPSTIPTPAEPEPPRIPEICRDDLGLEPCLVYTPDQLLDQFLELKSEFCQLLNKVNTIAATILEQDYHGLMSLAADLQGDLQTLKQKYKELYVMVLNSNAQLQSILATTDVLSHEVETIKEKFATKAELEAALAEKVSYEDLEKKVAKDELAEFQHRIEAKFCEYRHIIHQNERNIMSLIDNLRSSLGIDLLESMFYKLRDKHEEDIKLLTETLQHYIDLTNDECAAPMARVKVLKDLKCLSCDTGCVMRRLERGKVSKLPNVHNTTAMLGPLITYELSTIRKSGIMGYYRKDELPNTTKGWLARQEPASMQKCVPRHTGGDHTITSRKDFADRVMQKPKSKK